MRRHVSIGIKWQSCQYLVHSKKHWEWQEQFLAYPNDVFGIFNVKLVVDLLWSYPMSIPIRV
ncbi:MAG: hypothetical protein MI975_26015 [Cytophagales bacterium]|nr:hypothetical protein [Cytophagales bacterium]